MESTVFMFDVRRRLSLKRNIFHQQSLLSVGILNFLIVSLSAFKAKELKSLKNVSTMLHFAVELMKLETNGSISGKLTNSGMKRLKK